MTIILAISVLFISFYLLAVVVDEFFIESLDLLSQKLNLSPDVAGATLMAIGSSAPELFTSLIAVTKPGNHADIGAGTIIGSALFNILVIIGASAMFRRAQLNWQPIIRDTLFYSLSIIILLITFRDGKITLFEALLFPAIYLGYIIAVINWKKILPYKSIDPLPIIKKEIKKNHIAKISKHLLGYIIPNSQKNPHKYLLTFSMSIIIIGALSYLLVESAIIIAETIHISTTIVALTVLAIGTSIPDLISSIIVAKQGKGDMAVSNAIGSNIFDILFGLGIPWIIVLIWQGGSIKVSTENLQSSVILLFASVFVLFFLIAIRKWSIGRKRGLILISLYLLYLTYAISQALGFNFLKIYF